VRLSNVCARCRSVPFSLTMSRFNTDMICMECEDRERAHPKYAEAAAAELRQVRAGNYNYAGVGKPHDL